ncbi:MAG TPA: hypothetical protein VNI52_00605 [Sphingobacteriaceae bacterium]|nr:hypothetical protein [Sphingobacteriaceae bacterium]
MKKSFVFIPAILIVLFLLNSFVLKEKEAGEKPKEEGQSCIGIKLGDKWMIDPFTKNPVAKVDLNQTGILSIQEVPNNENTPGNRVNFSIAIQRPNTFFNIPVPEYMVSVQQANLKTILKSCYFGDVILLKISEPGKYGPNIQRIKVGRIKPKESKGGC